MNASERVAENIARTCAVMEEVGVAAVVSARPEDAAYLTPRRAFIYRTLAEARSSEVVVLSLADGRPMLFTMDAYVPFYEEAGIRASSLGELESVLSSALAGASVALPSDSPLWLYRSMARGTDGATTDVDPLLQARLSKSPKELAAIEEAAAIAGSGMRAMLEACSAGVTEAEVAAIGEGNMRSAGAESFCFSTLVISGPELGLMREVTTTRRLQDGDWVMIDGGCALDGYNAEFARSLQVGGPDDSYLDAYRAVYRAQRTAIDLIRKGVRGSEIDRAAREVIVDGGFEEHCYRHITGHGIGTGVWEPPILGPEEEAPLVSGSVVSVEPGIFIRGVGGIRIEDLVCVTDQGPHLLTHAPVLDDVGAEKDNHSIDA